MATISWMECLYGYHQLDGVSLWLPSAGWSVSMATISWMECLYGYHQLDGVSLWLPSAGWSVSMATISSMECLCKPCFVTQETCRSTEH